MNDIDEVLSLLRNEWKGILIVNQVFYTGSQKYGREYFTNQEELIKYFDMKPLVKNVSYTDDHDTSYETHTVFRIE